MTHNDERALGRIEVDPDTGFTLDDARDLAAGLRNRTASALAIHRQLDAVGMLRERTLLEYRCDSSRRGCLLLRVFETPVGPATYKPPVRFSPAKNANTHPAARAALTTDGDRRWEASADLLDVDPPAGTGVELWVSCDHVHQYAIPSERVNADLRKHRGGVVVIDRRG